MLSTRVSCSSGFVKKMGGGQRWIPACRCRGCLRQERQALRKWFVIFIGTCQLFFFCLFRTVPMAYGSSQAASCGCRPQPQPCTWSLTHGSRPRIEPPSSWILVRFITAEPQQELLNCFIIYRYSSSFYTHHFYKNYFIFTSTKFTFLISYDLKFITYSLFYRHKEMYLSIILLLVIILLWDYIFYLWETVSKYWLYRHRKCNAEL